MNLGMVVAVGAIARLNGPRGLMWFTLALFAVSLILEWYMKRKPPGLVISVAQGHLEIRREDTEGLLGQCPIAEARLRIARWNPRPASLNLDTPVLSLGSLVPWANTAGPGGRPPRYVISAGSWSALVEALKR
jgi:hypothetical protein